MIPKQRNLIVKFLTNQASFVELEELELWLEKPENKQEFISYVKTNYLIDYNLKKFESNSTKEMLFNLINKEKKALKVRKIRKYMKYAAVFLGLMVSAYYFNTIITNQNKNNSVVVNPEKDKHVIG